MTTYSNITVKPMLNMIQRTMWTDFVNNSSIFPVESLAATFEINSDLSMLIFAGIETSTIDTYARVVTLNNKKKRFLFNNVKTAIAIDPVTHIKLYEVVYVEMTDVEEFNGNSLPLQVGYNNEIYYPNSVINWQLRIAEATDTNNNMLLNDQSKLPLWMRTLTRTQIPGFKLGIPICYCKVGKSSGIALNIANYNNDTSNDFNFNKIDYTIDRYIIDSVLEQSGPQYLIFNNSKTTI